MSMKSNVWLRACSLLILLVSMIPVGQAGALDASVPPPVDMFQLPWDQGIAWYAIDGIDNGIKRPASSSHNYRLGGAIDFAPHLNMVTGENTSNFWVTAAASGTVVATATCYVTLAHANGWVTQYQFLGNIQVRLGDVVERNQRLGVIADGVRYRYCPGYQEINIPHLHFIMRPSIIDATLAGWLVKYNSLFNSTTFTKNGTTVGLNKPLMNTMDVAPTPTSSTPATSTPPAEQTATPTSGASSTSTPTQLMSPTPTLSGPYVSTTITPQTIMVGESALVTVRLNNVPTEGYRSTEFTCSYNANLFEVSNITIASLFGPDPVSAIHGPEPQRLIVAIAASDGHRATTSGTAFTFDVRGLQQGQTVIECRARVSQNGQLTEIPFVVDYLTIQGNTPTPNLTPSSTPTPVVPPESPTPTGTAQPPPQTPLPTTTPGGDWLTFINSRYGFMFGYPPGSQIVAGGTDNGTRIDLPFLQGTNLREKYLEMSVVENPGVCQSPLASSGAQSSETVVIAGITFLKQAAADGAAGNLYEWVAYSTLRNNVCVSLGFVLHSLNPGNFATPPPVYDYGSEAAVFGQIVSTFSWLTVSPTNTPTFTPIVTATGSPAPTVVSTPLGPGDLVPSLSFVPVVTGLSQPVFVTHAGDGSGRLFVLERVGRIRVINNSGVLLPTPYLDITSVIGSSGSEEGLLGLAFHPNYESNGLFFVAYTNPAGNLVLARYSVSSDTNVANPASAMIVLTIPHPGNTNHNGGMLAFGNDGYLYWSTGDGGGAGDVPNNAQNVNSLLGKILRLDINAGSPYAIPPDNPFVGVSGARGEIWDYGFRNPWRFSFDRSAQDMYIGDVGQGNREEIDFETSSSSGGLNYGWRVMEGSLCFNPSSGCDTSGKVLPVAEYDNNSATCAVTGGYVYRGSQSPQMTGIYFYGDFCSGEIWGLLRQTSGVWDSDLIMDTSFLISSFGEDEAGELYLTDYSSGSVQKIVTSGAPLPTPAFTSIPAESPTPTTPSIPTQTLTPLPSFTPLPTFTGLPSPTPTLPSNGSLTGSVIASKPVTVSLFDSGNALVASVTANPDGTFSLNLPAGTYTLQAAASGFLSAQGSVVITAGTTTTKPTISLLAGDLDNNNAIDQFDAMTIGMSYNAQTPLVADLNNDGNINVLDLEALARNYRETGPTVWQ